MSTSVNTEHSVTDVRPKKKGKNTCLSGFWIHVKIS